MRIELALFAYLADLHPDGAGGRHARTYELPDGSVVADVVERFGLPDEPRIIMVNGRVSFDETPLADGDRLAIFPPVAGG